MSKPPPTSLWSKHFCRDATGTCLAAREEDALHVVGRASSWHGGGHNLLVLAAPEACASQGRTRHVVHHLFEEPAKHHYGNQTAHLAARPAAVPLQPSPTLRRCSLYLGVPPHGRAAHLVRNFSNVHQPLRHLCTQARVHVCAVRTRWVSGDRFHSRKNQHIHLLRHGAEEVLLSRWTTERFRLTVVSASTA